MMSESHAETQSHRAAPASWPKVRLGEICEIALGKMLDQNKNKGELRRYLANVDVRWGSFALESVKEMPFLESEIDRYSLKNGDIIMCEGGEPGRCAVWKAQEPLMMYQKALHRIRAKETIADNFFLYYYFLLLGKHNGFDCRTTGSTIKHLPREQLLQLEVPLPPLSIQCAIGKKLSQYDELIENNTRRIAILERKAEQLYKEWFVRRRKSAEKASKESWCTYSIKELCYINRDTISAKDGGFISYLDTSSITGNKIAALESYDLRTAPGRARRKVKRNSIVYSIVRPNLKHHGIIKVAPANLIVSTGFAVLDAKHDIANVIYLFLSSQEVVDYCQMIAEGAVATYPSVHPEDIGNLKMSLPSIAEAEKWNRELEPLFTLATNLQRQNALLAKERDLLLPRLMSGRIEVKHV